MSGNRGKHEVTTTIRIHYRDGETARAVQAAISPDNFQAPKGTTVEAETEDCELHIFISCSWGIMSMVSTLDDLLSCVQAAERAISGVRE